MLGAIIGDIVGSRFEFDNTTRTDFEFFTPECSYTDDTICTVAIADAYYGIPANIEEIAMTFLPHKIGWQKTN